MDRKLKQKRWIRAAGLVLVCGLLGGCYATPPTIEGNGEIFQEYPTAQVQQATSAPTQAGILYPSAAPNVTSMIRPQGSNTPTVVTLTTATVGASVVTPPPSITIKTDEPTSTPPNLLKKGVSGESVRDLQRKLKALGYLKGSADGDFGESTEAAVKAFQKQMGLHVDGVAGLDTLRKLSSTKQTAKPEFVEPSNPNVLKKGMSGDKVYEMQKKLKALGYLKGSADGDFGEATEDAVKAFQRHMGLYADGIAGKDTLNKLYNTRVTAKPSATRTPKPTSRPDYSSDTFLKIGSSGSLVTKMQNRLIELGYLDGKATGKFDSVTEQAVIAFQKRNCSYWDGVAGKMTLDALFSSNARGTSSSSGMIGASLQMGSSGSEVRNLQSRLKKLGYYNGSVDGDFGKSTRDAVIAFQKQHNLTPDGKVGGATSAILYSTSAQSAGSDTLEMGSRGDEVVTLQNRLKNLGYYNGPVDGDFGDSTRRAVITFQRQNGLTADGKVGDATAAVLYSSSAVGANTMTLEMGSHGDKVIKLQSRLSYLGYLRNGEVDGDFGESTRQAVMAFQRRNGLTVDGKAGLATQEKLYSSTAASASPTPRPTQTPIPDNIYVLVTPSPDGSYVTLRRGNYGNLVRSMQTELKNQHYFSGTADGYFGEGTEDAVKNFQRVKGLKADGVAGPATLRVLYEGDFPEGS